MNKRMLSPVAAGAPDPSAPAFAEASIRSGPDGGRPAQQSAGPRCLFCRYRGARPRTTEPADAPGTSPGV